MALKRFLIVLLLLSMPALSGAVTYSKYEQLTIDNTSGGIPFTLANISSTNADGSNTGHVNAVWAVCTLTGAEIAYTYDGSAPTSSIGQTLEVNQTLTLYSTNYLKLFRGIRTGGSSGTLRCHYTD